MPSPQPPVVLAEHLSLPLGLDIRVINKVSQNLHAEMLLRLLGREKGASASVAGGLDVLRGFLTQADVRPEEYAFLRRLRIVAAESGLSSRNRKVIALRGEAGLGCGIHRESAALRVWMELWQPASNLFLRQRFCAPRPAHSITSMLFPVI